MHNSVFERMNRGRDPSLSSDKVLAGESVHRHDRRMSQQSSEFDALSNAFADHRDQSDGCRLRVDHADRHLIGDDARYG